MLPGFTPSVGLLNARLQYVLASTTDVVISALFSANQWTSGADKVVIIPSGVTIGGSTSATPAMRTGTGRGGALEVVCAGTISGGGGTANSGVGGTAFYAEQSGVTLRNSGTVRSGGGGGGAGGAGGTGVVQEGPTYQEVPTTYRWSNDASFGDVYWDGVLILSGNTTGGSYASGGWTYYRGAYQGTGSLYYVYRQQGPYSGGAGGAGGRGQGYDGAAAAGSAGSAGGTNAGTGGTGGTGGAYGATGSTGSTGANGNSGSGVAGTAGGITGYAIHGIGSITLVNSGTITGTQG